MLLLSLCGLARRASGFIVVRPAATDMLCRRLPPSLALRPAILLQQPLHATTAAAAAAAASSKGKGKKGKERPPPAQRAPAVVQEDEEEEDEEDEMTEAELLRLMKDPKGTDAVWAKMLRSMRETQGVDIMELEEEEEEDDEEEEEGVVYRSEEEDDDDEEEEEQEGLGAIHIRNSQRSVAVDTGLLRAQLRAILEIVDRADHDVSLWLTNDRSIREYNDRYRGIRRATDILSFPFHEYETPGQPTPESLTLNGRVKDLGDMLVSVPYVQRACERDREDLAASGQSKWSGERGSSGAMAGIFDVQGRLPYLAIHGVLHLLGHDHEKDGEYDAMVAEEERVITEFVQRFPSAAPPPLSVATAGVVGPSVGEEGKAATKGRRKKAE